MNEKPTESLADKPAIKTEKTYLDKLKTEQQVKFLVFLVYL